MKKILNNKGLTLIEIIVSLAIIGIIIVSFLNLFSSSYTTIFSMGHKTKAIAEAQKFIDEIYKSENASESAIEAILAGTDFEKKNDYNELINHPNNNDKRIRYSIETQTISGENNDLVSIQIYYQNGKHFVTLTSVIP